MRRVAGLRQASPGTPMMRAWLGALLAVFAAWLCPAQAQAQAQTLATAGSRTPNIAFHYGSKPPVDSLQAFDIAVVEPDSGFDPHTAATPNTQWFSYVSIGEVAPSRSYLKDIPTAWLIGNNDAWGARVVDQAAEGWPAFYVDKVIAPLWQRGFRGFFLDTLDSYQLKAKTDAERARQEAGMVAVIRAIKARYPEAKLIFNRGFEILPQVNQMAYAVAFESLYRGWDQGGKRYTEVSEADRNWLLGQARTIREQYRLPVISIDYCPPAERKCARDTAARIRALDIIPYVADPGLQTVGIGNIEVMPRRVLVVQDREPGVSIDDSAGVRFVSMPLNYLGYRVDFAEASQPLPEIGPDRYAGVVIWMAGNVRDQPGRFFSWVQRNIDQGVPVVFLNDFGAHERSAGIEPAAQFGQGQGRRQGGRGVEGPDDGLRDAGGAGPHAGSAGTGGRWPGLSLPAAPALGHADLRRGRDHPLGRLRAWALRGAAKRQRPGPLGGAAAVLPARGAAPADHAGAGRHHRKRAPPADRARGRRRLCLACRDSRRRLFR